MHEQPNTKPQKLDAEEMLDEALAEPVLTGETNIPAAQMYAAAFLVLAVGAAASINAWLPLRVEPAALALHLANALAVFTIARRILSARTELPAMACGMLFAVHPLGMSAMQAPSVPVLAATLLALLALALTLAATNAERTSIDFQRVAAAVLLYTVAALLYPPMVATAPVFPLLHRVRTPRPAHGSIRVVYGAYALVFVSVLVALPFLVPFGGNWREAVGLYTQTIPLLLGFTSFSAWHPAPTAPEGWLGAIGPLALTLALLGMALAKRNAIAPALGLVLLLTAAIAYTIPLDNLSLDNLLLETALYPTLAGLALALGGVLVVIARLPLFGPVAAVATAILLVIASTTSYARHALAVEPLAPLHATLDIYPDEGEPRLLLARALYEQGNEALGVDAFTRGQAPVSLRAGDARSHYQSALRYTGEAIDYWGLSAEAMLLQGKVLIGLGRAEEAADDLFIALRLAPWRADIARALADAYATQGGDEANRKAAEYYEAATRLAPGDELYQTVRLRHLERNGMLGRAALTDDRDIPDAHYGAVRELRERDQRMLQGFQGNAFNPEALLAYAEARIERGQPQQAAYALHEALRRDETLEGAWGILADLSIASGDHATFAHEYAELAEPADWEARALDLAREGRWHASLSFLRNTLPDDADDAAFWLRAADLAFATGNADRAAEAIASAEGAGADEAALDQRRRRLDAGANAP